ncbi:MAG: DUF4352 domain-containing protein [Armatimonadota bacterium]
MLRSFMLALLLLASLACFAAATVVINGKTVTVPTIEQNGKAFLDIVALMKLLGGTATYDAKTHKVVISTTPPAPKPAAPGTVQLAGDNGRFGNVYSIRKEGPLYFILKSAEFTTSQVLIGDTLVVPNAEEKLLVLHFSVQNPEKNEQFVRGDSLRFTVVDAMNVNHEAYGEWGDAASKSVLALSLKPAQKIDAYAVITVPAKGTVPKLLVLPGYEGNGPILRYDLRGQIAGLPAPIADPADPTGATALEMVPGKVGVAYPYASFDVTVEGFSYSTTPLEGEELEEGARYLFITVLMHNKTTQDVYTRSDTFNPVLTDTDGAELTYKELYLASSNRAIAQHTRKGQQMRVRLCFEVPPGSTPAKLALKEGWSRAYEFEIK